MGVDVNLAEIPPIEVAKEGDVWEKLSRFVDPESPAMLSPPAFFRYVACPLRFYFYSVARLKADDELTEEVDAPMFGTILHAAAQRLYERIAGEDHPGGTQRELVGSGAVERAVAAAIVVRAVASVPASVPPVRTRARQVRSSRWKRKFPRKLP